MKPMPGFVGRQTHIFYYIYNGGLNSFSPSTPFITLPSKSSSVVSYDTHKPTRFKLNCIVSLRVFILFYFTFVWRIKSLEHSLENGSSNSPVVGSAWEVGWSTWD